MLLTVIMQQKLDEKTQLKWAEFNSDSDNVPQCTEFLKFLDLHARCLESVSHTAHKQASGSDHKLPVKQSYATSKLVRGIRPPFLLLYDVNQYYNEENAVLSQVMRNTD